MCDCRICDPEVMNLLQRSGFYNYYESYLIWYDVFICHNVKNRRSSWKGEMVFCVSSIVLFSSSIVYLPTLLYVFVSLLIFLNKLIPVVVDFGF
jgi:hypothetical protein